MAANRYSYDSECSELARHFLGVETYTAAELFGLSQAIQDAVEDWFAHRTPDADLPTAADVRGILRDPSEALQSNENTI